MIVKGNKIRHLGSDWIGLVTQISGDKVWVTWTDGKSVESLRAEGTVWVRTGSRVYRPTYRWFGTSFQWTRVSATWWQFEDGWGRYDLKYYVRNPADERYDTGWYLTHPEDDAGEYMGKTVSAAAAAKETQAALHEGMLKRRDRR